MIQVEKVTKRFAEVTALKELSLTVPQGRVYGLVGSNGAGKSTLLRLLAGIYRQDAGQILLDEQPVFNNPMVKEQICFVADELYFLPQSNLLRMAQMYQTVYHNFSMSKFEGLCRTFELPKNMALSHFSKGMKRQAAIILALAAQPKYLMLDETFDGVDPVKRAMVKKAIYEDITARGASAIISSHSLRELEDTCDQLAMLHKGGIVLESDIAKLQTALFKVQAAFSVPVCRDDFSDIDMVRFKISGRVVEMIVRGDRETVEQKLSCKQPLLVDLLPLTLEEVFMYELDALGYAVQKEEERDA